MPLDVHVGRRTLALACASGVLLGCASRAISPTRWLAFELKGLTLQLVDAEKIELFQFHRDGFVSVTLGVKNGPLVSPVWYWRVVEDQLVIATEPQGQPYVVLSGPRTYGERLVVRRNAIEWAEYEVRYGDV